MPDPPETGAPAFRMTDLEASSELSVSARLTLLALYHEGVLCHGELVAATGLAERTIRDAISQLNDHGLITSRPRLRDVRKTDYELLLPSTAPDHQPTPATP